MASNGLLGPDESPSFCKLDAEPAFPALLVCDHAANTIPACLNQLGISPVDLMTHFAVDIGAAGITEYLNKRLALPAVMCGYSRLVVDCNRALTDPTAYPLTMDNLLVPGNQQLDHTARQQRADAIYWPYHHAVRDALTGLELIAPAPALIAIHSFTPVFDGVQRPWDIGILWDKDPRIALPLLDALRGLEGMVVGDNEPYSGKHPHDFTIDHHGEAEGLPHISIEIRQDLIDSDDGVRYWGEVLADALTPILSDTALYSHWTG